MCVCVLFFVVAIMRLKLCERWKRTAKDSSHTGKIRTANLLCSLAVVSRESPFRYNWIRWIPKEQSKSMCVSVHATHVMLQWLYSSCHFFWQKLITSIRSIANLCWTFDWKLLINLIISSRLSFKWHEQRRSHDEIRNLMNWIKQEFNCLEEFEVTFTRMWQTKQEWLVRSWGGENIVVVVVVALVATRRWSLIDG